MRKSEAAPLFENAKQNSNYLRMNAQCELRKCGVFRERPEGRFRFSFAASKEVKARRDRTIANIGITRFGVLASRGIERLGR